MSIRENGDIIGMLGLEVQLDGTTITPLAQTINFIGGIDIVDVGGVPTIDVWDTFLDLIDTPSAYTAPLDQIRINATNDGLEFFTPAPPVAGSGGGIEPEVYQNSNTHITVTLDFYPIDNSSVRVFTDSGTRLFEGVDYTISGKVVTFLIDQGGATRYFKYYKIGTGVRAKTDINASVNLTMTLSETPNDVDQVDIYTDSGIKLFKDVDYTISGTTVTFLIDQGGATRYATYNYTPGTMVFDYEEFTGVATNISLSQTPAYSKGVDIYTDSGIMYFEGVDYTISGNSITFVNNQGGATIRVIYPRY